MPLDFEGVAAAGSILGTYLPAFLLVPRIGTRGSILVAAGLLLYEVRRRTEQDTPR